MSFKLHAVVVKHLDCDVLVGMPFMRDNNIILDIPNDCIVIGGNHKIKYKPAKTGLSSSTINRTQSYLLRSPTKHILLPGEFLDLKLPDELVQDVELAVEPRCDNPRPTWPPPHIVHTVGPSIRLANDTSEPIPITKHQHLAQVRYTCGPEDITKPSHPLEQHNTSTLTNPKPAPISIDPDHQLSNDQCRKFEDLHHEYATVFSKAIGKYNDSLGKIRAFINMGSVEPPPQKARLPIYKRDNLDLLQNKMDELESNGVLAPPEEVGVTVEHVSPSFLVQKPGGGHRLVTAFNNIGMYAKPSPSKITTSDEVFQFLAQWRYIIKSDMTSQFFQLPMRKESMKYLGIVTPYKGIRVYTRAAMGMPGSTECLDQLMCRVLGDLMYEGVVMKIADDLYVGGNDISSLHSNWARVLQLFQQTNLRLSPSKTVIAPVTTTVLGWIWSAGSLTASAHKVNSLGHCDLPLTVKGLRGWCGAAKHIKACLPQYSSVMADLEKATAGKESREKVNWTPELKDTFTKAQSVILKPKTITIPRIDDQLIITTDGAVRNGGMGAVMYIERKGKLVLGGYYSAKLKVHHTNWLPCEIEALAIGSAVNHWGNLILQSHHTTQILTDSRPCIQAFGKLARGEYSMSARVSTFLSALSRYSVKLQHIAGTSNLPADYLSRSPMECSLKSCQVCKFISEMESSVVRSATVDDIVNGRCSMPFTDPLSWKRTQQNCPSLKRVYAHLSSGTRPGKKVTNAKDVKRYLRITTLSRDGLITVKTTTPFTPNTSVIVVPRHVLVGILTSLHLQLQHPTASQLYKLFTRYFYALDAEKEIKAMTDSCSQCASLKSIPKELPVYSTSAAPNKPGTSLACDVLCRARQKILVVRDVFSSYTLAALIPNEQKDTIRNILLQLTAELKATDGATVRVDGSTTMQSLINDTMLQRHGLVFELGRLKNENKNPIAEKAIQELEFELKRLCPTGDQINSVTLAFAVANLNKRIRNRGLSAKEIITQRDSITGDQLHFDDNKLAEQQHNFKSNGHIPSARSKVPKGKHPHHLDAKVGDLVYIKKDGSKHTARDRYLVSRVEDRYVIVQKLSGKHFGKKQYQVLPSEIFHVPNTCKQLRNYQNQDSSSDSTTFNRAPSPANENGDRDSADSGATSSSHEVQSGNNADTSELESDHEVGPQPQLAQLRRSVRDRAPPKWVLSNEWDTD